MGCLLSHWKMVVMPHCIVSACAYLVRCSDSRAPSQRVAAVSQSSQWPPAAAERGDGRYSSPVHHFPGPCRGGEGVWQAAVVVWQGQRAPVPPAAGRGCCWWTTMAPLISQVQLQQTLAAIPSHTLSPCLPQQVKEKCQLYICGSKHSHVFVISSTPFSTCLEHCTSIISVYAYTAKITTSSVHINVGMNTNCSFNHFFSNLLPSVQLICCH